MFKKISTLVILLCSAAQAQQTIVDHEEINLESRCQVDPLDPTKMFCMPWCNMRDASGQPLAENEGWNCDDNENLLAAVNTYNLNNPNKTIDSCNKGTLGRTGYHLADCEVTGVTTVLTLDNLNSDFSCIEDCGPGNNQQAGGPFSGFVTRIDALNSGAQATETDACEGYGAGCNYINSGSSPWLTVTDGDISQLASAGYTYQLNISQAATNESPGFEAYCEPLSASTVDITNTPVNFSMTYDANYSAGQSNLSAGCLWSLTLVEYLNGQPTGQSKSAVATIDIEHVDI